jgi:rhomboid protease GluP
MQELNEPAAGVRIPARTKRQAMDWSLALASQGIEPVIEHNEETGWALVVSTAENERSLAIIEQYRLENRHWPWRKRVFKDGPLFDSASMCWVLLTMIFFWFSGDDAEVRNVGIMDSQAVAHGQWWRLFTATLLHADVAHLATNSIFGLLLMGLAMGRYGSGLGMLGAFLAGVCGNIAGYWIYPEGHRSLGASGVVTGALGLLTTQSLSYIRSTPRPLRFIIGAVGGGVMLFVLLGTNKDSDVVAHFGGFVSGAVFGALLSLLPKGNHSFANACAGLVTAAFIIWPWWMALRPDH